MKENLYYSVELMDYSMPGFVSGSLTYYGTQEEILSVLSCIEEQEPELKAAAMEFFNAQGDGMGKVFPYCESKQLFKPMRLLEEKSGMEEPFSQIFVNTWDCNYYLTADSVTCQMLYLSDPDGTVYRCIRAKFRNLYSHSNGFDDDNARDVTTTRYWGHPGILINGQEDTATTVSNVLMFYDKNFKSAAKAKIDMENPSHIDYSGFFADIFGDG